MVEYVTGKDEDEKEEEDEGETRMREVVEHNKEKLISLKIVFLFILIICYFKFRKPKKS